MNFKLVTCWVRRCGALVLAAAIFLSGHTSAWAKPLADPPLKRIEVSISEQQMVAWLGDRRVFEFPVTTGQEGQETVPGEYEVLDKEVDAYSEGWLLNMPHWIGIYQLGDYEDGFHALPTDDEGQEYWRDALGKYPASHGCIVLSPEDAAILFDWADIGTTVDIHE